MGDLKLVAASVGVVFAGWAIAVILLPAMPLAERFRRAVGMLVLLVLAYISVWLLLGTIAAAVGSAMRTQGGDIPREAVGNAISVAAALLSLVACVGLLRSERAKADD